MKRVLIVDDAAFMRMSLKLILEKNGFEVVGEAANGRVAVERYKELKPDIVTMDVTMPEMDGVMALKEIRAFDPDSRVVVISAMGQDSFVREAVKCGAKDFIVKPFSEERVIESLRRV